MEKGGIITKGVLLRSLTYKQFSLTAKDRVEKTEKTKFHMPYFCRDLYNCILKNIDQFVGFSSFLLFSAAQNTNYTRQTKVGKASCLRILLSLVLSHNLVHVKFESRGFRGESLIGNASLPLFVSQTNTRKKNTQSKEGFGELTSLRIK